jgi:hypothetical protein
MNTDIVYLSTELDLAMGLFRGETISLYVPDAPVEGEHWTVSILAIRRPKNALLEVETDRGTVKVRTS